MHSIRPRSTQLPGCSAVAKAPVRLQPALAWATAPKGILLVPVNLPVDCAQNTHMCVQHANAGSAAHSTQNCNLLKSILISVSLPSRRKIMKIEQRQIAKKMDIPSTKFRPIGHYHLAHPHGWCCATAHSSHIQAQ